MAVLTLCASLLYLTRVDAPGGLRAPPVIEGHVHPAGHGVTHRAPARPGASGQPESPHGWNGHSAHCPLCFTGAFALEPGPAVNIRGAVGAALTVPVRFCSPRLSAVRHADPRAPPQSAVCLMRA
ncbi:hypothetical protein GCM10008959_19510 [Deinococcus seoulensis]|uniref:DUF2946 domain-containing protein n=1 Tax=Deinococcus seoulensis TaxID=1837379 RepID=A0ABQ2RRJ7_9DEIO|nr:hypothetical protein [Deinococcus seoulensis]GGR57907.1 hypothetical protein GCM10008959_19510 [Deinococcus seoulensis]